MLCTINFVYAQECPNIIVIFADDQGYADIGANGIVSDIITQDIDRLTKNGVRMNSGFVTAPQCAQSRVGLLTGRYQQRFGSDNSGVQPDPLEEVLISDRLCDAVYVNGMTGNWHLQLLFAQTNWVRENVPGIPDKKRYTPGEIPRELTMKCYPHVHGFDEYFYDAMFTP